MSKGKSPKADLTLASKLTLFMISYSPLLLIMIVKTVAGNWSFFHFVGISYSSIQCYLYHFSWLTFLTIYVIVSLGALILTLRNLHRNSRNGYYHKVTRVEDCRPESINYLATYIFPFVFEGNSVTDIISMVILFVVILTVTINTSLIIQNPVLCIFMAVYTADITLNNKVRHIFIISKDREIEDDDERVLYRINKKIYIEKTR